MRPLLALALCALPCAVVPSAAQTAVAARTVPVAASAASPLDAALLARLAAVEPKVVAWRRDFHAHPELGNRETRTAGIVAAHLRSLGLEVQTGVAHTGVVALLRGGRPGPVVLLRADMDALPVTERADVPFASRVTTTYNGAEVGVMHACGHDAHTAMLMGVAEALAPMRATLPGTIKFVFQPAEEGVPRGERGGAELMVEEGVLENPRVDAAFGLHIWSTMDSGTVFYTPGGTYASVDDFQIRVRGRQAHGASPWQGLDPVVASAHIVTALQTIVSRNVDLTRAPAVVTVGKIAGGVRSNIIPEEVEMLGTLRALTPEDQQLLRANLRRVVQNTAEALGVEAEVLVPYSSSYPVTHNHVGLTRAMVPMLEAMAGTGRVRQKPPVTGAEDFSFFALRVPSVFVQLGARPAHLTEQTAPSHHTPDFVLDEASFGLGMRTLSALALDYLRTYPNGGAPGSRE